MGTYVDDGFSGTNTEHRPGFRLMMQAAMDGKLDVIITKSVSRFARNSAGKARTAFPFFSGKWIALSS